MLMAAQREGPGAPLPFDVLLMSYTMFERDSEDAKMDRSMLQACPRLFFSFRPAGRTRGEPRPP